MERVSVDPREGQRKVGGQRGTMFMVSALRLGGLALPRSEFCSPPGPERPALSTEGGAGTEPPSKASFRDASHELQEIAEFGGRAFSPGFNHAPGESRSRWLPSLPPPPSQSRPLPLGLELWPRLELSRLHVSLRCCFFHKRIQEIKKVGKELGITPTIIRDEELKTRGFGGEWVLAGDRSRAPWPLGWQGAAWGVVTASSREELAGVQP